MTSEPLLSIRHLSIAFRSGQVGETAAVRNISFDIPINSTVALVGESGSGKSVTALAIIGLLPAENAIVTPASEIRYRDQNLLALPAEALRRLRSKEISMIFQEPMTSLNPVFTVGEQVAEVLRLHMGLSGRQALARAVELFEEVGIPEPARRINAYPFELSGGQQQRVMIAMAIACQPKLLIADEPTTALDVTIQKQILDLIAELQARHQMSVLFITHDLALVSDISHRIVVMQDGEVREAGDSQQILQSPQHPYTQALLACRPQPAVRPMRLPVVEDFLSGNMAANKNPAERKRGITAADAIILEVRALSKDFWVSAGLFKKRAFPAVKLVSFKLARGKTLGIVGESGSGKTTVALTLMRLYEASAGEVLFDGQDLLKLSPEQFRTYRRRIQIVFQNPYASLNPRFTIEQIISEPMQIHGIGKNAAERAQKSIEWLSKVGLNASAMHKYPHEFSGGQRQRIAIARCLTMQPEVLILDESVSALDVSVQAQILNLLQDLQDEFQISYVFISHDLAVVKYMADQVMVMHDGEVVELANSDELYRAPQHPYTRQLLAAIPGRKANPTSSVINLPWGNAS